MYNETIVLLASKVGCKDFFFLITHSFNKNPAPVITPRTSLKVLSLTQVPAYFCKSLPQHTGTHKKKNNPLLRTQLQCKTTGKSFIISIFTLYLRADASPKNSILEKKADRMVQYKG